MAKAEILGHIDCPTCGTKGGMRITHDKNGDPFGFCESGCNQQMRIGGEKRRVAAFVNRYPWAGGSTKPVTVPAATTAAAPVPVPPPEAKKMATPFDLLAQFSK